MKIYATPSFELLVSLDNYCEGSITIHEDTSSADGGILQIGIPADPLKDLA